GLIDPVPTETSKRSRARRLRAVRSAGRHRRRVERRAKRLGHRCAACREQGKVSVMNVTQAFQDLINRPTPAALAVTFGVSILLLLIACALLLGGRRKWLGLGMGGFGLLLTLLVLFLVDQQTVTSRESESVIVTRPRYQERTRILARSAMFALPGVVVL